MPEPEPTAGTVKVKVGFNGICGTDLHEYYAGPIFIPTEPHPLTGQTLPLTIGQEFSGVITGVGAGVTGYSEGDRVAMPRSTRPGWRPRYRPRWPVSAPAVQAALASLGARKPTISVAIYEKPMVTPLLNLVMNESRVQGRCATRPPTSRLSSR